MSGRSRPVHFIVTNRHVLQGAAELTLQFTRKRDGQPVLGQAVRAHIAPLDPSIWFGHPRPDVDVAVLPLSDALNQLVAADNPPFFRALPESLVPDDAVIKELDALERVIFIGYPAGLYDG